MVDSSISLDLIIKVIVILNFFGTVGVALWAWLRGPSEANNERLDGLETEVEHLQREMGSRLDKIEGRLLFMPTVTDLGKLQADMRETQATHTSFQREMHRMSETLTRIEDFLLSQRPR